LLEEFISAETSTEKKESLKEYMVMDRIYPPMIKSWMLRDSKLLEVESLSELGLFSNLLIDSDKNVVLQNENIGTLMRTKGSHSNEGGVNSGYSVIDVPILYAESDQVIAASITPNVQSLPE